MRKNFQFVFIIALIMSMLLASCAAAPASDGKAAAQAAPPVNGTPGTPPPSNPAASLLTSQEALTLFTKVMANIPSTKGYGYIQAEALNANLAYPNKPFILDVRDPSELQQSGYIAGAVNIPLRELLNNLDKLPAPNGNIVIYSNTGYRSGMALAALMILGYTNVHDLAGGFSSWVHVNNFPIVTGTAPVSPIVLSQTPVITNQTIFNALNSFLSNLPDDYYQVDDFTLSNELTGSAAPTLVDINTASDHQQYGHIQGAIFIPFSDFFNNLDKLPSKDQPIVIYAVGGGHSSILLMGLRMMGYTNVLNLKNGIYGWKNDNLPVQPGGG